VWHDEFNGSTIDTSRWGYDIGTGPPYPGWGNKELEYYTSRPENAYVASGLLHIVARSESYSSSSYTSARLKTYGLFSPTYGRFEFRARLPQGPGFWPAFWLMPRDMVYGDWAASGEIDVMENRGQDPTTVLGTLHFGGAWPNNDQSFGPSFTFPAGDSVTNFHVYALEWSTNEFQWYVDGISYQTQTSWWSTGGAFPAPFNAPFYLVMNLAVGGYFVGSPDASTVFPSEIQVDYVRVYDFTSTPVPRLQFTSIRAVGNGVVLEGSNGPPLGSYYVLTTSSAVRPHTDWTRIATNQFDSYGRFTQSLAPVTAPAFYHLEVP